MDFPSSLMFSEIKPVVSYMVCFCVFRWGVNMALDLRWNGCYFKLLSLGVVCDIVMNDTEIDS